MPRKARLVVPGYAHHVTQRGVRGTKTFFCDEDYALYLRSFRKLLAESRLSVLTYCLMPNHIHAVLIPEDEKGLANLFRPLHGDYARRINSKHGWRGHLWQERFYSVVMDEAHTLAALRYVEMNPVRAGMCSQPDCWPWSSVHANLGIADDEIVDTAAVARIAGDWRTYLHPPGDDDLQDSLRKHTRCGRPAGGDDFIDELERVTGKTIRPRKTGPPKRG